MLVLVIAKGVADRFNDSIFVKLAVSVKRLPYIAHMPHLAIRRRRLKASAVATGALAPLPALALLPALERLLKAGGTWEVWPVAGIGADTATAPPDPPEAPVPFSSIIGFVERDQIERLMEAYLLRVKALSPAPSGMAEATGALDACLAGDGAAASAPVIVSLQPRLRRPSAKCSTEPPPPVAGVGPAGAPSPERRLERMVTMQAEGALLKSESLGMDLTFQPLSTPARMGPAIEEGEEGSADGDGDNRTSSGAASPRTSLALRLPSDLAEAAAQTPLLAPLVRPPLTQLPSRDAAPSPLQPRTGSVQPFSTGFLSTSTSARGSLANSQELDRPGGRDVAAPAAAAATASTSASGASGASDWRSDPDSAGAASGRHSSLGGSGGGHGRDGDGGGAVTDALLPGVAHTPAPLRLRWLSAAQRALQRSISVGSNLHAPGAGGTPIAADSDATAAALCLGHARQPRAPCAAAGSDD
jgi:hypothetical protein